ncbi:MAG: PQQ-binding-like beta-propeller repeat protein [Bryobacteraceae bacterium]
MKPLLSTLLAFIPFCLAADPGQWPKWRGPNDDGMALGDAPLRWSDTENIRWKLHIPGRGHSSPVLWGDKIFLTTAIPTEEKPQQQSAAGGRKGFGGGDTGPQPEHRLELICIDKKTGKVLWQRTAKTTRPHEGYHRTYGSFASNSPVTDGKHIFAFFGSRGIYCYDLDGKLIWEKDLGVQMRTRLQFGEGTAAVLHENTLILSFDHEGDSFIAALDKNSGKELWRAGRDEASAWAAPLVVDHAGRKQAVVSATNRVRSYDVKTGKVIWECGGLGGNVIPAPVVQDGVVYVMSGFRNPNQMAIRLGREGDLTGTDAVVWSNNRATSYSSSPVLHENKLYFLTDNGMISCFNARTGQPYYHQVRLPKPYTFKSSLVGANGKLYMAAEDGDVVVLKMGEKYEVLATNTLADQFFIATPAIADGEIFLRGQNTLFCISGK